MRKILQQGHADGLCGIYCLLNFLHRSTSEGWTDPAETLWYLLDASRQFGWFNPYTITQGFEEYQLKKILDLQIENYRMDYETYFISEVAESLEIKKFSDLADRVIKRGGSIVASWDSREHWVLIVGEKGVAVIADSSADGTTRPLSKRQRSLDMDYGLVIVPKKRRAVVVDL